MKKYPLIFTIALALGSQTAFAETQAIIETNYGKIELVLDETKAPKTVANFVDYANQGFYTNTIFHRVIGDFMIQGGGFNAQMIQKTTAQPIQNEADNGLKNQQYTIAMARTAHPHSATSQFFINVKNNDFLNHTSKTMQGYGYTVFGRVSKGTDVVDKISRVPTTNGLVHQNVPIEPVVIKSVKIVK